MTVVEAMENRKGCRNLGVNAILKRLVKWEEDHDCRIDIVYVNTKENYADDPSRKVPFDELRIHSDFFDLVEKQLKLKITFGK